MATVGRIEEIDTSPGMEIVRTNFPRPSAIGAGGVSFLEKLSGLGVDGALTVAVQFPASGFEMRINLLLPELMLSTPGAESRFKI
jgi:hypothetical protein